MTIIRMTIKRGADYRRFSPSLNGYAQKDGLLIVEAEF